jgi:predicted NUDIX family phosphoesterase
MNTEEKVLVVERKVIESVGMFEGIMFDVKPYFERIFSRDVPRFMTRSAAEKNPDFKQLIPYVIMGYNGTYLSYVRGKRAGEKRLVGNRSIGIGGHIDPPDDMPLFDVDYFATYLTAVEREVDEEVSVQSSRTDHIAALLNDESNEVGSVHLGVVHYWDLAEPKVEKREQMITQLGFMTAGELHEVRESLESWSAICVDNIEKIEQAKTSGLDAGTFCAG